MCIRDRFQPDFFNVQGHAPRQISHGFFMGPLFQEFSHSQQEHNRTGGIKVPTQDRDPDGGCIQKRDFDLPLPDTAQPRRKISKRPDRHDPRAQGRRHQELSAIVQQHFRDQFFLIGCVQLPSGIANNSLRHGYLFIPEVLQQTEQRVALPCITAVSYTHLDVYKRQAFFSAGASLIPSPIMQTASPFS